MTEDQKYKLASLVDDMEAKNDVFQSCQRANVQTDPEKRRKQSIDYHIAETEYLEARRKVDDLKAHIAYTR